MSTRNSRELLVAVAEWYGDQDENLSAGLRSAFDALRLYEFWTSRPGLPEFCDEATDDDGNDLAALRAQALGYDPLAVDFTGDAPTGVKQVLGALDAAETLLDSAAYVLKPGDTAKPLRLIRGVLSGEPAA